MSAKDVKNNGPVTVSLYRDDTTVKQVQVGRNFSLVLYNDGTIVGSGSNFYGAMQMRTSSTEQVKVVLPKIDSEKIVQICTTLF